VEVREKHGYVRRYECGGPESYHAMACTSQDQQNIIGYSREEKAGKEKAADTSRLFFDILRQPLQTFEQAFPRGGATWVDIP